MVIGKKDLAKLFAITIVTGCMIFVCTLFLNYNIDIVGIKEEITSPQAMVMYEAQVATGKVVVGVTGGCLAVTTLILLIFYVKNQVDSHGKELGILKALGYSNVQIARHFWVFGISVLLGCGLGFAFAYGYLPHFYKTQNDTGLLPQISPEFHLGLFLAEVFLPTFFFALLAVVSAFFKLKKPVNLLLREVQERKVRVGKEGKTDLPFLKEVKRNTLKSRKVLVFFIWFSAFCFSAMTQMAVSMRDLSSESMSVMMITIGLILAFLTLLMSLTTVVNANTKTIAMMKVFGYSEKECSASILGGYRPVSYLGFAVGTVYQYFLLRIVVDVVFADYENMPEYSFNVPVMFLMFVVFLIAYEGMLFLYSKKIGKQSVKAIMLE